MIAGGSETRGTMTATLGLFALVEVVFSILLQTGNLIRVTLNSRQTLGTHVDVV